MVLELQWVNNASSISVFHAAHKLFIWSLNKLWDTHLFVSFKKETCNLKSYYCKNIVVQRMENTHFTRNYFYCLVYYTVVLTTTI